MTAEAPLEKKGFKKKKSGSVCKVAVGSDWDLDVVEPRPPKNQRDYMVWTVLVLLLVFAIGCLITQLVRGDGATQAKILDLADKIIWAASGAVLTKLFSRREPKD